MSEHLPANLAWLPRAPDDFSNLCRDLGKNEKDWGKRIRFLANHALNENQLNRLGKAIETLRSSPAFSGQLTPFKLGIIGNATINHLAPVLTATAARYGIALECVVVEYGQVLQEAVSPQSAINTSKPDAVLIALDYHGVSMEQFPADAESENTQIENALQFIETLRAGIRENGNALCVLQTVPRPPETLFGSFDAALPGTVRRAYDLYNQKLAASVYGSKDVVFDVAGLAETVGLAQWHDPTLWNIAKIPFSNDYLPLYADHLCRVIGALRGKSRRCLILDLDNTLWGGVIGDDGLEGIILGQGDPTGEAHLDVQKYALALRDRGVVLAVSSKNNDDVARGPFRKHPEMLLKEDHIAVFQANWSDKATNITWIAEELSLGLDAMVFLDDNPVERDLVRKTLPMVAVPELPEDPALYARTLAMAGYFEATSFTSEDTKRADFYQQNARRVSLQKQIGDVDAYLSSLNMVITFQSFNDLGRARITQLINKSNQYNLTTKRYTEAQVSALESDPTYFTRQVRLLDKFGDNGMISVVICKKNGSAWEIDTWLMSCRVLGRRVENAVLQEIIKFARKDGVKKIKGVYLPTERNKLAEDHYAKLGFALLKKLEDGTVRWELDLAAIDEEEVPMEIVYLDQTGEVVNG